MDKNKKLDEMTLQEKLAGMQAGAGAGLNPMDQTRPVDNRVTQDDMDRAAMVQQMLLKSSPTAGQVQPNAMDKMQEQQNFDSAMQELGDGTEVPEKPKRFQGLFNK